MVLIKWQVNENTPQKVKELKTAVYDWLFDRGISLTVLTESNISWDGSKIVIPVYDKEGNHLFNKYRRNPFDREGQTPKYQYDKGGLSVLYNIQKPMGQTVFITEGELDCLLLNSLGISAVSSTGGSMTFRKEWVKYFEGKEVYICYDNDDAGIKGGLNVQMHLPHAKMIFLPRNQAYFQGKDITEFIKEKGVKEFSNLTVEAKSYPLASFTDEPLNDKKKLKEKREEILKALDWISLEKRSILSQRINSILHLNIMNELLLKEKNNCDRMIRNFSHKDVAGDEVERARQVSIERFVKFNSQHLALCLWHFEKHPSMRYNDFKNDYPNTVKCFACGAFENVIGVVQKLHSCNFMKAVEIILGNEKN